jgi:hypothetical protein
VFAGYAVWFYDFLRLCCDPELSPVPPNIWGRFMKEELEGYDLLFLKFIDGPCSATRTARDAFMQLNAVVNSAYSDLESDTSSDIGSDASCNAASDTSSKAEADASSSTGSEVSSLTGSDAEDGAESQGKSPSSLRLFYGSTLFSSRPEAFIPDASRCLSATLPCRVSQQPTAHP